MSEQNLTALMTSMQIDIENIKKQYMEKMQEAMKSVFSSMFATYPQIKTIYWSQWVPGFNDGEPCEFTVGEIYFSPLEWKDITDPMFEDDMMDADGTEAFNAYETSHVVSEQMKNDMRNFDRLMNQIESSLEASFDSNSWIRAHRDGFEVEEYDCGY